MKVINDPKYYSMLCDEYGQKIQNRRLIAVDRTVFNIGFRVWVKEEYGIINNGTSELAFPNEQDYTFFMLKFS